MINEIEIHIWDQVAAYAAYQESKLVNFQYADRFPKEYQLSPIMMPRGQNKIWNFDMDQSTYHGLPGLLADALPDRYGQGMMNTWFSRQGIKLSDVNSLDRLCYLGTRAMGALEFFPSQEPNSTNSQIELEKLIDISQQILQNKSELKANDDEFSRVIQMGSSAGGARAKAIIALNPKTKEIRSGQFDHGQNFEHWIIKFDGLTNESLEDPQAYTNIEYAYYLMAKAAGIKISESQILKEGKHYHFLTKRFDRKADGSKLHVQTLCALAHIDYNSPRTASYEILFRVANRLELSMSEKEQIFKRMVFNVIGRNHDDHSKNFAFMMDQDLKWRLAPAYDLTYSFNPENYWLKEHNLLINNKASNINKEDLLSYANNFHIKNAENIIEEISLVFKKWQQYSDQAEICKSQSQGIANCFNFLR